MTDIHSLWFGNNPCYDIGYYPSDSIYNRTMASHTTIPCQPETRHLVKSKLRGGETYDELLRRMAAQYDPAGTNE